MDSAADAGVASLEESLADFDEFAGDSDELSEVELAQLRVEHAEMMLDLKGEDVDVGPSTSTYLWVVFNPRSLIAYVVAMVAGFKAGGNISN
jgi:hypothetical protein